MNPPRLLVVSPNWIGDAVMAQPLLQLLRRQMPQARIDVLAPPWVAPVWRAAEEVAEVVEAHLGHGRLQWRERRALARRLRGRGYDAAYVLPNSLKSALVPFLAGIPRRIGYRGEWRYGLVNVVHHDDPKAPRPMAEFYTALADAPVRRLPAQRLPEPRLKVDLAKLPALCAAHGIAVDRPWVAFAPGAEFGPAKRWPPEHFAALAQRAQRERPGLQVLLLGSPKDRATADEIVALAPQALNLAGATTLDDALLFIAGAQAVASNDSGLMHVAAALGRPLVAFYGPTDPRHTPPASPRAQVLWLHLPCAPCQQRVCPLGHHDCLRTLGVDMAWERFWPLLQDPAARAA
ncbi:lipopolysaccharide heptosyltransferase II [Aquabacterium sp. J223]|uniref:lipopolysaccharide heptosyltransferase II n=1 Tax=Aquabacterium sp. J223 TaxID=2898431 RepID=UPI0021AD9A7E|nr:lipopolysaccharide heptosyltransferase II [Aquabacterium sp. J223]UUX97513.1 lipopolysaccharide heptosyltransferase II [Aquabacterium sp. J223]